MGLLRFVFFFLLPKPESSILQKQCLGSNISSYAYTCTHNIKHDLAMPSLVKLTFKGDKTEKLKKKWNKENFSKIQGTVPQNVPKQWSSVENAHVCRLAWNGWEPSLEYTEQLKKCKNNSFKSHSKPHFPDETGSRDVIESKVHGFAWIERKDYS